MLPTWFLFKRAHLTTLIYGRAILRSHTPLTPARYDVLTAIHRDARGFILQAELTRDLGLHHSTVSKMLTRLEELGLVARDTHPTDDRAWRVRLTGAGRELLHQANDGNAADGMAELLVESGLARDGQGFSAAAEVHRTNLTLRRYAVTLWDTSIPLYPLVPPVPVHLAV
jgi:DNA-binding MarR family transcriptional regulator